MIRSRDHAHVDFLSGVAAQALKFLLLQDAQQLGLQLQRNVTDLVEEERSLVRQFEASDLARDGSGEGASLVAEELALQQAHGNGRAVDLDEGALAPRTAIVNGARDQFFAGAGLAFDEHRGVGGRDGLNLLQYVAQSGTGADNVFEVLLSTNLIFQVRFLFADALGALREFAMFQRILHSDGDLLSHLPQESQDRPE